MAVVGYHLSSEEHDATTLVRNARRAEEVGFGFASISDHLHPWLERQGHSPFVWSVLGGGDGVISLERGDAVVSTYRDRGGRGPAVSQVHVCVAPSRGEALSILREWWPNTGLPGAIKTDVPLPRHFEAAVEAWPNRGGDGRRREPRVGTGTGRVRRARSPGW